MKNLLVLLIFLLTASITKAQVLYNETFDNFTLGDLVTDYTGIIPGQGGWLTSVQLYKGAMQNGFVTVTAETGKGKVLTLVSDTPPQIQRTQTTKTSLHSLIDQRTVGNNVIKLEFDFYTGSQHNAVSNGTSQLIYLGHNLSQGGNRSLIRYSFRPKTGLMGIGYYDGVWADSSDDIRINNNPSSNPTLPFNTWVTFIVYLDYNNKKVYFETPYFNAVAVGNNFLAKSTSANLIEEFKPDFFQINFIAGEEAGPQQMINKLDNIKLTALNAVPPYVLSSVEISADKFNLYPNPATNVVNITNSENMLVNQIAVYDTTGKLISTQNFNEQAEIQLNVEKLANGTYMLHLQTNEGTAVKKLVKK